MKKIEKKFELQMILKVKYFSLDGTKLAFAHVWLQNPDKLDRKRTFYKINLVLIKIIGIF